jgi:Zn-dependent peptidase ImmA (M78 family)
MKSEPVSGIQPALLRWARASLGMSIQEVALKLKRDPTEIQSWETGDSAPSYPQLEKLAYTIYKRPLAVFFLPSPPEEKLPQREFRTLPDIDMQTLARDTYLHIRYAQAYQLSLKDLFENRNPVEDPIWKNITLTTQANIAQKAQEIRDFLGISLEQQVLWHDDDRALKAWRQAIENSGVFVFKAAFKQKEISGFCLSDTQFPIIYLNNSTSKSRQTFSLMHELAHLLFHVNGLSKFNQDYLSRLPAPEKQLETFCNAMAAELLIPELDFHQHIQHMPRNVEQANDALFAELANRYSVSREAILRRFLDRGRVSYIFYDKKSTEWAKQKQKTSGGSYYSTQGAYISNMFAREVVSRHYQHKITLEQAADFLGIKPKNYSNFETSILRNGAGS